MRNEDLHTIYRVIQILRQEQPAADEVRKKLFMKFLLDGGIPGYILQGRQS